MTQGNGSISPLTALTETRVITFDFGTLWRYADPPIFIQNILSITCTIAPASQVQDYFPSGKILGLSELAPSPSTLNGSQAVAQTFGNLLPGVIYIISCTVQASDNSEAVLWNYLTSDSNF